MSVNEEEEKIAPDTHFYLIKICTQTFSNQLGQLFFCVVSNEKSNFGKLSKTPCVLEPSSARVI
jgi:hypothetical protein